MVILQKEKHSEQIKISCETKRKLKAFSTPKHAFRHCLYPNSGIQILSSLFFKPQVTRERSTCKHKDKENNPAPRTNHSSVEGLKTAS